MKVLIIKANSTPRGGLFRIESRLKRIYREGVRRGVAMEDTLCVLCRKEEETTSHILVLCEESIKVWNFCLSWLGISSVNHNDLICHFEQFSCLCLNQEGNRLWKSMWVSVVWCIWKHRNRVIFNQGRCRGNLYFGTSTILGLDET